MVSKECLELGIQPNVIRQLFVYGMQKAKEIGADNVYDYSLGNPSVPAPAEVNQAIVDIVGSMDPMKVHGYSVAAGFEEARNAVAEDLSRRFGVDAKGSDLFFTCGASPAVIAATKALITGPDSEIIIVAPFFPEYVPFIKMHNGKPVIIPPDTKAFQIDFAKVEAAINENTQAIIVNSPNNPSGVVYSRETVEKLAELFTRKSEEFGHPIYIIADEPYRELVYDGLEVPFVPCFYKNTLVCYSYSKSLSLPGERIGYVYVPSFADDASLVYNAVAGASRAVGHICPPTLIQRVVERCASVMPDLEPYDINRKLLYGALTEMGYECARPDGAFYLFIKAPGGDANAFSEKAKLEQNLLLVPADAFGCPGYLRAAYCVSNDMIKRSLPAFKALIDQYK